MTRDQPVPDHLLNDEPKCIGEPELSLGPVEEIDVDEAPQAPDCPVCGAPALEIDGRDELHCPDCGRRPAYDEKRDEARRRRLRNEGNFMPISAKEWYGEGGRGR